MKMMHGSSVLFDVEVTGCVFAAKLSLMKELSVCESLTNMIMTTMDSGERDDPQEGSLHHFHLRLGHLAYDTVERLAKDPASGIKLTDRRRPNCLTCAEGKGTRTKQPKQDSG